MDEKQTAESTNEASKENIFGLGSSQKKEKRGTLKTEAEKREKTLKQEEKKEKRRRGAELNRG